MVVRIIHCKFKGCDRAKYQGLYCSAHAQQQYRDGEMRPIPKFGTKRVCKVPECTNKHWCKNLCHMHYMQYIQGLVVDPEEQRSCEYAGCSLKHYAKDLCWTHYTLMRNVARTEVLGEYV